MSTPAPLLIRIVKINPAAPTPRRARPGDAGLDLVAAIAHPLEIPPGGRALVATGIAVEIPRGYEGQVRGRSSLSRIGIVVPTGTIDSGYRGEIGVVLINLDRDPVTVAPWARIAQLVIAPVAEVECVPVDSLSETERGAGGWGSTGG